MPLLEQVLEKNPDTVKIVFKNMPLRFHKFAEPSARAALAAHKQGKFWEFHEALYKNMKECSDALILGIFTRRAFGGLDTLDILGNLAHLRHSFVEPN